MWKSLFALGLLVLVGWWPSDSLVVSPPTAARGEAALEAASSALQIECVLIQSEEAGPDRPVVRKLTTEQFCKQIADVLRGSPTRLLMARRCPVGAEGVASFEDWYEWPYVHDMDIETSGWVVRPVLSRIRVGYGLTFGVERRPARGSLVKADGTLVSLGGSARTFSATLAVGCNVTFVVPEPVESRWSCDALELAEDTPGFVVKGLKYRSWTDSGDDAKLDAELWCLIRDGDPPKPQPGDKLPPSWRWADR